MATFEDLKNGLEEAFDSEGAKGVEATIQINIDDLTNFFVDINDGSNDFELLDGDKIKFFKISDNVENIINIFFVTV